MIAVMTDHQAFAAMKRQSDVTVRALNGFTAGTTQCETRITAAIEKYDRLFSVRMCFANCVREFLGKHYRLAVLRKYIPHIDE